MGPLALALAVLAPQGDASFDECIDRSDRIAVVTVTSVVEVRQKYPFLSKREWPHAVVGVAELSVETSLVGPAEERRLFALAQDGKAPLRLEPGQRYLVFLERDRTWRRSSEGTRAALSAVSGGESLLQISSGGSTRRSPGPDAPSLDIEVRTRRGPKRVRIYPQDPATIEDAALREQMQRALAVWDALPVSIER